MIKGIGINIIDVSRFKRAIDRWGEPFTSRLFTEGELEYCTAQRRPETHLAARFAAKVSFVKAQGEFTSFKEIEITRDELGRPFLTVANNTDINVSLTMSHDGGLAIAQALIKTE